MVGQPNSVSTSPLMPTEYRSTAAFETQIVMFRAKQIGPDHLSDPGVCFHQGDELLFDGRASSPEITQILTRLRLTSAGRVDAFAHCVVFLTEFVEGWVAAGQFLDFVPVVRKTFQEAADQFGHVRLRFTHVREEIEPMLRTP